jgi:hypothetical protein
VSAPTPAQMPTHEPDTVFWTAQVGPLAWKSPAAQRARLRDELAHHAEQLARALAALRGNHHDEDLALEKYFRVAARFHRAEEAFTAALADVDVPLPHVADRST